ncbi:MAG TPA: DUF1127 domain-containing protein [Paenirhodobacter sp.]
MSSVSLHHSSRLGRKGFGLLRAVMTWIEIRRTRIALGHLDTRLLEDIGVSIIHVEDEIRRPFWDI